MPHTDNPTLTDYGFWQCQGCQPHCERANGPQVDRAVRDVSFESGGKDEDEYSNG